MKKIIVFLFVLIMLITSYQYKNIEVKKDESISQYFQVQIDSINIIKLYVDSVSNPNGNLKLTFYNSKGEELTSQETELKKIVTPEINFIFVDNLNNIKNEIVQLKIEVIGSDSVVSIGVNDEYYDNQYIIKDNKKINKSIIMYYEGNTRNVSLIVHFLLIFFVSLSLYSNAILFPASLTARFIISFIVFIFGTS